MKQEIIIDARDSVLGRLASYAAKQALLGNKVVILNCEEAVVLGNKKNLIEDFHTNRRRGGVKGPFFPSKPSLIVKRAIRGMVTYKQGRGEEALRQILCFEGTPLKYANAKIVNVDVKKRIKSLKIKELK